MVLWQFDRTAEVTRNFTPYNEVFRVFGEYRSYRSIVWHSMEGSLDGSIAWWNKPEAQSSAHLAVARNGEIHLCVKLEDVAWHAGTNMYTANNDFWKYNNINPSSIGVELEGYAATGFTLPQVQAVQRISEWFAGPIYKILAKHTFNQIDGHHAHSEISNQRSDPGPHFDWSWIEAPIIDQTKLIAGLNMLWDVRQAINKDGAGAEGKTAYIKQLATELDTLQHHNYAIALTSTALELDALSKILFDANVAIKEALHLQ